MTDEERKAKKKAYTQQWLAANKDRVRERKRAYAEKNREKIRAWTRRWYAASPEHRKKRAAYHRANHATKREKINAYYRKRKAAAKLKALSHYGTGGKAACRRCGIDDIDVLTLDHVDNSGAAHRREQPEARTSVFWVIKHDLPPGFQTLCLNCNYKKHLEQVRSSPPKSCRRRSKYLDG